MNGLSTPFFQSCRVRTRRVGGFRFMTLGTDGVDRTRRFRKKTSYAHQVLPKYLKCTCGVAQWTLGSVTLSHLLFLVFNVALFFALRSINLGY